MLCLADIDSLFQVPVPLPLFVLAGPLPASPTLSSLLHKLWPWPRPIPLTGTVFYVMDSLVKNLKTKKFLN